MTVSVNDPGPYPSIPREAPSVDRDRTTLAPSERGKDYGRGGYVDDLAAGGGTYDSDAAEQDAGHVEPASGQRVFAPAWERVPKEPVPGHDEIVSHTDENTPERRAWHEEGA